MWAFHRPDERKLDRPKDLKYQSKEESEEGLQLKRHLQQSKKMINQLNYSEVFGFVECGQSLLVE